MRQLPPQLLTNRRGRRGFAVSLDLPPEPPPPLPAPVPPIEEWTPYAQECWQRFWSSPVSRAVDRDADWPMLLRWLAAEDEHHRLTAVVARAPVVRNNAGELVPNPVLSRLHHLDRQLQLAYNAFGMTPTARFRLGISIAELKKLASSMPADDATMEPDDDVLVDLDTAES